MTVVSPTFHLQSLAMPPKSNANSANSEETGARPKTTPRLPAEETGARPKTTPRLPTEETGVRPTPRMPAKPVAVVRPGIQIKQGHLVADGSGRGHRLFYAIG